MAVASICFATVLSQGTEVDGQLGNILDCGGRQGANYLSLCRKFMARYIAIIIAKGAIAIWGLVMNCYACAFNAVFVHSFQENP